MQSTPIIGPPVASPIFLVGQAPGVHEPRLGRPFAWTAGKKLFSWFSQIGPNEEEFREKVYMAAVCRCFPGKASSGGDRVPNPSEIAHCREWLDREIQLLHPELILPVGRLAIEQFLEPLPLAELIGKIHETTFERKKIKVLPLPHPSGASTWYRSEPGRQLLEQALTLLGKQPVWQKLFGKPSARQTTA